MGVGDVEIGTCLHAVVEERTVKCDVPPTSGLPLNGGVLDVFELQTCGCFEEGEGLEVGAGCRVVDVVVARFVVAGGEFQVVDGTHALHPRFVADDPSCLNAGEDAPLDAEYLDALFRLLSKA